jgi:hypothetical protein
MATAVLASVVACAEAPRRAPPDASFLVAAADSTFWITAANGISRVRRSAILLSIYDGRFHELYVTDDDRSFYDAVVVGQRIFRRDIVTGDSTLLFEDSTIVRIASAYAAAHPDESPLLPDEEAAPNPTTVATTETEIVESIAWYATVERHIDVDLPGGREEHTTRRLVMDLRSGKAVTLGDLMPDSTRRRVLAAGRAAFAAAVDSVRKSDDERAQRMARLLPGFRFDTTSFSLVIIDGRPAIAFLSPGRGRQAGAYALPLEPVPFDGGDWWRQVSETLPTSTDSTADVWAGADYDVAVEYDSSDISALIAIRDREGEEWPVGSVPTPVLTLHRLEAFRSDTATINALTRAFDDAGEPRQGVRTTAYRPDRARDLPAATSPRARRP